MRYIVSLLLCIGLSIESINAQFTCGVTGLLHMPNAEMQNDGTVVIGGNFLHKNNLPSKWWWGYDSYNYFINITFFERFEVSYICTLVQGKPNNGYHWPEYTWGKFTNQDRHFAARFQLVKESEYFNFMPSLVLGVNDPTTTAYADITDLAVTGNGNGFFNRWYVAATKHFQLPYGELGVHATYLYNKRTDYPLNGLGWGINFRPDFHKNLNVIIEHDTKTLNIGAIYSLWADHFNFLFELQDGKYLSCGLVYKVNLKGNNRWKSNILDY